MKLGQKNKKRTPVIKEDIDPAFFEVKFKIDGKIFSIAVDDLLKFEQEDLDQVTDASFDKALDQCSYYRYTFLSAAVELEKKLSIIEREHKQWYAGASRIARDNVIAERAEVKKRTKVPNNWFGSITKQDMENAFYSDEELREILDEYESKSNEMRSQIKLLYGLRDILEQRGHHLQSLGKRRLENNREFKTYDK